MSTAPIHIVVGEGHPARKGLLRFVLEGEGFDVVGSATTSAELARALAIHEPDVVVLDDGIGATAVQMTREVVPEAKIVLVWPGAVVPIGGDARVEPSQVLRQLGSTVERVAARRAPVLSIRRPDWVERVRKDPATLRAALAASGPLPTRPSVTELQRRGQRLHPMREPMRDHPAIAVPAMALVGAAGDDDEGAELRAAPHPVGAATFTIGDGGTRELHRRLGVIALAGAAVIGAAALSYALSGARITPTVVADPPRPTPATSAPSTPAPSNPQEPGGQGNPGGGGNGPDGGNRPDPPREQTPPPETAAPTPPEDPSPPPQDVHEPPVNPGPPDDPGPPDPGPPGPGPDTPDGHPFVLPSTRPGAMPTVGLPPEAQRQLESGGGAAGGEGNEPAAAQASLGSAGSDQGGQTGLVHRHKR